MPRFGTKSLLIGFAAVALWLATFSLPGGPGLTGPGTQIRKALLLVILVTSGVAAVCCRGRLRAFWSAFSLTVLLISVDILGNYYRPDFVSIAGNWSEYLSGTFNLNSDRRLQVHAVIWHGLVLGIATVSGLLAAWVYGQNRKTE